MRVLFCIHELAANGAVVALLRTAGYLVRQGARVTVLVPHQGPGADMPMKPEFEASGVEVRFDVDPASFDVAVGCTVAAQAFVLDMAGRLPVMWWIHEGRAGLHDAATTATRFEAFARADAIAFPTAAVRDRVWGGYLTQPIRSKTHVLPNIVPPADRPTRPARAEGRLRVICVGEVCGRKRQTDLIAALQSLARPDVDALFVGRAADPAHPLKALVRDSPERYRLIEHAAPGEMAGLYASADLLVLPSVDESFALAPLEAARQGVPSILTDLDCYADLWRHGENALVYPVGDVDLLEGLIRTLLDKPRLRRRLADAAGRTAERFDEALSGPPFLAVLRRLAAPRP